MNPGFGALQYEHKMKRQKYPKPQLRTVREIMDEKGIERPSNVAAVEETFKTAPRAKAKGGKQSEFGLSESPMASAWAIHPIGLAIERVELYIICSPCPGS